MAKKTVTTLIDDIDGSEAVETVAFIIDGTSYEIDLSADNAGAFRAAVQPYIDAARKTPRRGSGRRTSSASTSSKEIRAWAAEQSIDVPARGRIPADVQERYRAANG
ncbi:Lsr2 family protein [Agromyces sp. NPDC056523]|uniref:histone-like nucleoid-structuring protein Lsr2 n=1 Tax=Agromyces sp. NPDC056523 TaxID=3345850 RepID=UPI003671F59F